MVAKASVSDGFLIDGYPRELEQGTKFETEVHCQGLWTYTYYPGFHEFISTLL